MYKTVINGKTYNTDTATIINDKQTTEYSNDLRYLSQTIYLTKKGDFFVLVSGQAGTWCASTDELGGCVGETRIYPVSTARFVDPETDTVYKRVYRA